MEFEEKCKSGTIVAERMSLQEFAEKWIAGYAEPELEKTTVTRYKGALNICIYPHIGYMKLNDIKSSTVIEFLNNLRKKGYKRGKKWKPYSDESIRSIKVILSSVLSAAVADGLIDSNPCSVRQRKHKKVKMKEVRCFSIEQAARFLDIIEKPIPIIVPEHKAKRHGVETVIPEFQQRVLDVAPKYRALFCLTIFFGLRRGEILGLQWQDVDFDKKLINIIRTVQYTRESGVFIKPPKSQSGFRKIYLPDVVMQKLKEMKEEQKKYMKAIGSAWNGSRKMEESFVFIQEDGKPMFPSTPRMELRRILTTYNKSCKNEADRLPMVTLHELRHTCASILIASGLEATAVAQRLGHSDASITLQIYSHSFEERDKAAANALENVLVKKNEKENND